MNGLLIGRFQPFHLGHLEAINFALSKVDKLWLGIGSSNKPIGKENPFLADERRKMIQQSIDEKNFSKIQIFDIPDFDNHQKWMENIEKTVPHFDIVFSNDEMTRKMYHRHGILTSEIPFIKREKFSGTKIREKIRTNQNWKELVPSGTQKILDEIKVKDRLSSL
ncbi:cytidyltransferase [Nitrosopumilus sp. b1]|uniref:nicotinamide-nucleotide adenylyltransferase n=1 Tax=Nitrosopumilus sp. b1 TaxID=2109907 RepID=UPI0015F6DC4A|nr:nicotinamide-nucleotide adenylyltransferase [Nitrosopumilus sp. b1]KAF6243055.1 cytidyltransferase [Nitrosopumilus sp. b1]